MPNLTPQQAQQLDSNIKAMLANGASQDDVMSYANDFNAKYNLKKNDGGNTGGTGLNTNLQPSSTQVNAINGISNNQQELQQALQNYSATHQVSQNALLGYDVGMTPKGVNGSQVITAKEKADDEKLTNAAVNTFKKTMGHGAYTKADSANAVNQLKQGVKNGDLGIVPDAQGNDVIKNTGNFFQSFKAASDQAYAQDIENKYLSSIPKSEAISYLNRIQQHPETGIVKESDIAPNGLGAAIGSQAQLLGKGEIGALAGAESGATGGGSIGTFLGMVNDLANSGYSQALKRNYNILKQQGLNDSDAFDKASKAALTGEAVSLAQGALLSGEVNLKAAPEENLLGKLPPTPTVSTNGFENSLSHTLTAAPKVVGSAGLGSVVNDIQTNAISNGNQIDAKQMLQNSIENMKPMAIMHFSLGALAAIANGQKTIVPSPARPQMENIVASADRNQVGQYLQDQENNGILPQGTTQKVLDKLNQFDQQKQVVNDMPLSEEQKAAITGKLIQRQNLVDQTKELKKYGGSFNDAISKNEDAINGLDDDVSKIISTHAPYKFETDELTGERAQDVGGRPTKEETEAKQNVPIQTGTIGNNEPLEQGKGEVKPTEEQLIDNSSKISANKEKPFALFGKNFTDHAESELTAKNKETGLSDSPLTDKGEQQSKNLGKLLAPTDINIIEHNGVERTKQTAEEAAEEANRIRGINKGTPMEEANGIKAIPNKLLSTLDTGKWTGKESGEFPEEEYFNNPNKIIEGTKNKTTGQWMKQMEQLYQHVKDAPQETHFIASSKVMRALKALDETNGKWNDATTTDFLNSKKTPNETENIQQEEDKGNANNIPTLNEKTVKERLSKLDAAEINNPYDKALLYFANEGRIHPSSINELFGGKNARIRFKASVEGEKRSRIGLLGKTAPTIDGLAHRLWEEDETGLHDTSDYKNAIEQALLDFNSKQGMAKDLVTRYDYDSAYQKYLNQHGEEFSSIYDNMSEDDMNHLLQMDAEHATEQQMDDYLNQLKEEPQPQEDYTEKINNLQEQKYNQIKDNLKDETKVNLIPSNDLVKAKEPLEAKKAHDDIKDRYKTLRKLIDCL